MPRTFETTIEIQAPPEIVFSYLTVADRMIAWMGDRAELQPTRGGRFAVDIRGAPFRGEYLEVDSPRRVVFSWGLAGSDDLPPGPRQRRSSARRRSRVPGGGTYRMSAREVVQAYYAAWQDGTFREDQVRAVLATDLLFEGPVARSRRGADGFVRGLGVFVSKMKAPLRVLQQFFTEDEAAVLYECDLSQPEDTLRFAEFFTVRDGKIQTLRLVFDATEFH